MKILALMALACLASAQVAPVYPGAVSTTANLKVAVNGTSTLLTSAIGASDTSLVISDCQSIVPYVLITIDQEIMNVTGCSGTILIVDQRGFDNTTAVAHPAGSIIYANVDAFHHNTLAAEIEAIEASTGANAAQLLTTGTPLFAGIQVSGAFSSLATGASTAFTTPGGTFHVTGGGDAAVNSLTAASGDATITGAGDETARSLVLANGAIATVFNCTATGATNCLQQYTGDFMITGAGAAFFQTLNLTPYTPSSSSAACAAGQIASDANYVYACTATNTWKRATLSSF